MITVDEFERRVQSGEIDLNTHDVYLSEADRAVLGDIAEMPGVRLNRFIPSGSVVLIRHDAFRRLEHMSQWYGLPTIEGDLSRV